MKKIIGVSGKGGTGKTTIAAAIIRLLNEMPGDEKPSILAIDADPDLNLPQALGYEYERTVGDVRESILADLSSMNPKNVDRNMEFKSAINEIIVEGDACDLLVMGQPEKMGCYCPVNNMIRTIVDSFAASYDYLLLDCEAGLEHISRRTTQGVNTMIVVSDATAKGLQCAVRIKKLITNINSVEIKEVLTIANRVPHGMEDLMKKNAEKYGIELAELIPFDPLITENDIENKPIWVLPDDSPLIKGVRNILEKVLKN